MADFQAVGLQGGMHASGAQEELLGVVRDIVVAECRERLVSCGRHASEQLDALILSALRQLPPHLRDMPAKEALQLVSVGGGLAAGHGQSEVAGASTPVVATQAAPAGSVQRAASGGMSSAHPQHPLVRAHPGYPDTHWACDRCNSWHEGMSYHCATCSYDLCDSCWVSTAEAATPKPLADKKRQDGHAPSGSQSTNPKRFRQDVAESSAASSVSASVKSMVDPGTLSRMEELEHKTQEMQEFARILGDADSCMEKMPVEQRRNFMKRASDTCERMLVPSWADAGGA